MLSDVKTHTCTHTHTEHEELPKCFHYSVTLFLYENFIQLYLHWASHSQPVGSLKSDDGYPIHVYCKKNTLPSQEQRMQKCVCKQHALMYNLIKAAIDLQKALIKSANG